MNEAELSRNFMRAVSEFAEREVLMAVGFGPSTPSRCEPPHAGPTLDLQPISVTVVKSAELPKS